ncbi:hypothetical protein GCM10025738_01780 [Microbacterium fluvii]
MPSDGAGGDNDYPRRVTDDGKGPSTARITIWIVVGAIGAYMLISGIIGIVSGGS